MTRRRTLLVVAAGTLAVAATGARLLAPWYVREHVIPSLGATYGLTLRAEDVSLAAFRCAATIEGLTARDGDVEVLAVPRADLVLAWSSILGGRTVVEDAVVDRPVLYVTVDEDGRTNVEEILARGPSVAAAPGEPATLVVRAVVHGGTVVVDDRPRATRMTLRDVEAVALELQTGGVPDEDRMGRLLVDASLVQPHVAAPVTAVAWEMPAASKTSFVAHVAVTGVDLTAIPAYVDGTRRRILGADVLDVVVTADVEGRTIARGAAVAYIPGRTESLSARFGGDLASPTIDTEGSLTALFELPFARLGTPGRVVWGAGGAVVGGAVGIVENLGQGDVGGAAQSLADALTGTAGAVGGGIADTARGIGRALGLSGDEEDAARDVAAAHAKVRTLLLAERRAAARAWSEAHGGAPVGEDP